MPSPQITVEHAARSSTTAGRMRQPPERVLDTQCRRGDEHDPVAGAGMGHRHAAPSSRASAPPARPARPRPIATPGSSAYTGNYMAAVWMGNDDFRQTKKLTGGILPAQIWREVMTYAHQGVVVKPIPFVDPPFEKPAVARGPLVASRGAAPAPVATARPVNLSPRDRARGWQLSATCSPAAAIASWPGGTGAYARRGPDACEPHDRGSAVALTHRHSGLAARMFISSAGNTNAGP